MSWYVKGFVNHISNGMTNHKDYIAVKTLMENHHRTGNLTSVEYKEVRRTFNNRIADLKKFKGIDVRIKPKPKTLREKITGRWTKIDPQSAIKLKEMRAHTKKMRSETKRKWAHTKKIWSGGWKPKKGKWVKRIEASIKKMKAKRKRNKKK